MSLQVLSIKLQRADPSVSWGFNIQGGRDFGSPFVIQKVNPNSLADQSSVRPGDYILRIGNNIVEHFTHAQAREAIIAQGNHLELTLQRGAAPRTEDYGFNFQNPQHRLLNTENVNRAPVASPQVGIQLPNNKALLTQSYNSPMGLYSNQNIADTLTNTLKNDYQYSRNSPSYDSNSSLSSSSILSNSFSPSSSLSLTQKPPLPIYNSKPRPFRRAETVEPRKLESIKIIQNDKENIYTAIPVKTDDFYHVRSKSVTLDENRNIVYNRRDSISGRDLLKNIESSFKIEESESDKSEIVEPVLKRTSWTPTKKEISRQISCLNDPTRQSITQSKSFKLLQQTLDNGLAQSELVFYDRIQKKTEIRRCSIDISQEKPEIIRPVRKLSRLASIDQISIEENTQKDQIELKKNTRSQSVSNNQSRSSSLIGNYSYLSQLKANSNNNNSNNGNSKQANQRRHSYIMNIKDQTYLQEAQKLKKIPTNVLKMNPLNPQPQVISTKPKITFSPSKQAVTDFKPYQPVSPPQYHPIQQTDNHRPQPTFKPAYQPPTHPVPPPIKAPQQPTGTRNFTRGNKGSALFNLQNHGPSQPQCTSCYQVIRGPFISAVGKIWCPNHFICANPSCGVSLHEIGFVEENGKLYCEKDFETYFAPKCAKCSHTILGECCYALEKTYHSECFVCAKCKQTIGSGNFHIEDGVPYCERDFNALFSTKCAGCQFPIEAGDKFVEALIEKWHVECFICTKCNLPLSGGFAVKGNKPFCKKHAY